MVTGAARPSRRARRPERSGPGLRHRPGDLRAATRPEPRPIAARTASTTGLAARRDRRPPVSHMDAAGMGFVRNTTSPSRPSVPSEPTSTRHRSNPLTFLTVGPPARMTLPAALTYRASSKQSPGGVLGRAVGRCCARRRAGRRSSLPVVDGATRLAGLRRRARPRARRWWFQRAPGPSSLPG